MYHVIISASRARHFARTFSTKGTTQAATHLIKVHKLIKPGTADTDKAQISINAPRHFNATVLRRQLPNGLSTL